MAKDKKKKKKKAKKSLWFKLVRWWLNTRIGRALSDFWWNFKVRAFWPLVLLSSFSVMEIFGYFEKYGLDNWMKSAIYIILFGLAVIVIYAAFGLIRDDWTGAAWSSADIELEEAPEIEQTQARKPESNIHVTSGSNDQLSDKEIEDWERRQREKDQSERQKRRKKKTPGFSIHRQKAESEEEFQNRKSA